MSPDIICIECPHGFLEIKSVLSVWWTDAALEMSRLWGCVKNKIKLSFLFSQLVSLRRSSVWIATVTMRKVHTTWEFIFLAPDILYPYGFLEIRKVYIGSNKCSPRKNRRFLNEQNNIGRPVCYICMLQLLRILTVQCSIWTWCKQLGAIDPMMSIEKMGLVFVLPNMQLSGTCIAEWNDGGGGFFYAVGFIFKWVLQIIAFPDVKAGLSWNWEEFILVTAGVRIGGPSDFERWNKCWKTEVCEHFYSVIFWLRKSMPADTSSREL